MDTLNKYLSSYAVSHQNSFNKKIHFVFVPLIVMSVLGLLMSIPTISISGFSLRWDLIVVIFTLGFYWRLSKKYFFIMGLFLNSLFWINTFVSTQIDLFSFSIIIFTLSWIMQFIGHKIEGKKPSFLEDLLFLLIGPLWVFKSLFKIAD